MFLGLDIGGTKVAGVLMSSDGQLLDSTWATHDAQNAGEAVRLLSSMAQQLTTGLSLTKVTAGVSVAGLVGQDGRVTRLGMLELDHDDLASKIERTIGLRLLVSNDADATLRAAIAADPDGPTADALLLALGTGVAGAVMSDGRLLRGRVGLAGELGHLPICPKLPYPCVCGGYGCLEQYASGRGLAERAVDVASSGSAEGLVEFAGVPARALTAVHVIAGARDGEPAALSLVDDAAQALACAVVVVGVIAEPARVYVGGSLGHAAADLILARMEANLSHRWPFAAAVPPPSIVLDSVGPHAAAVGAALLAQDALERSQVLRI